MHSRAERGRQILALPGILGGVFSVFIGALVLLFSIPSLGRQSELGFLLSPAAGAILFIVLGLAGIIAATLAAESRRTARRLLSLLVFLSLTGLVALAFFREWAACALVIIIVAASWTGMRAKRGSSLLLFSGLVGFPIGQAAMTFLPYGWKTWAISGVLFIFCSLLFAAGSDLGRLPLLKNESCSTRRQGYFLYSILSFLLILLAIAALIHVPAEAGPGIQEAGVTGNQALGPLSLDGRADQTSGPKDCHCPSISLENVSNRSSNCEEGRLRASILSPGDVRTFPHGEPMLFEASACGKGPLRYLWRSSLDGVIGSAEKFESSNLSPGWHTIDLTVTNSANASATDIIELGIAEPWICGNVHPRPKYYPVDTSCQEVWPNATSSCQEFEVCHPDLDFIVAEAVDCCDGTPQPGSDCAYACANAKGDKKRCRGLYIIRAFGPEARYMQGYALFKACCSGYPECTRTCGMDLAGTCAFREGFNENVTNLSCRPEEWGLSAWRSDTNMSENSAVLGLFPTHATVNLLHTGVCIDYAAAVTTLLRKTGYNRTEALSSASTGYDLPLLGNHPGHAYNLVLLPNEDKYYIVDTTGNGEGINLGGMPHYFWFTGCFLGQPVKIRVFDWWVGYCSKTDSISYNDAGDTRTPKIEKICGCS